ncbi:hypothetical protein MCOR17_011960, partial [Pyricularia oryzae]
METISKKSVATSAPFRFIVGPERQNFTIHSYLISEQSPVLKALVEGGFKEATERSVEWDDVNEQTFVSFWQFVYSGDYETPEQLLPPESGPTASHTKADRFDAQSGVCSRPEQSEPEVLEPDQEGLIKPFEVDSWGFIASSNRTSNKCCKKCKCCKKKKPHQ